MLPHSSHTHALLEALEAGKCQLSLSVSPGTRMEDPGIWSPTPRVPDTCQAWVPLWKGVERKCWTPPTSTEPSRAISCKQRGNNPAAPEPAQDDSLDITARLSLRSPEPNVKASPGRKLGQREQGKSRPWQGRDQWRDQCVHQGGTDLSPPPPRSEVFPENKARGKGGRGRAQPS